MTWIVNTIHNAGKISFQELNRKWMATIELSDGEELKKRSFHKWKEKIFDQFGLIIECENFDPYLYYIKNDEELNSGGMANWLLNTYSVSNSLVESKSVKDKILLEEIPSGSEYLQPIIDAMKECRMIHINYYSYWKDEIHEYYLMPLCVKLFRQRWYMVGKNWTSGAILTFSLDRIRGFRTSSHTFEYPTDFNASDYFEECFGITKRDDIPMEHIVLKATAIQSNYLRDLPLHPSQKEFETTPEYSIFSLDICPTYDFKQEILHLGDAVEIVEPESFRQEIKETISNMLNLYK